MTDYSFIIPCLNCEKHILNSYQILIKIIKKLKIKYEIIFVDDGSSDDTYIKLSEINNKYVKIFKNKKNIGKSKSIINNLKKTQTKYIIIIDCDLPYAHKLKTIIHEVKYHDLVITNRNLPSSKLKKENLSTSLYLKTRYFFSYIIGFMIEVTLNLNVYRDTQSGLKAFKINKKILNHRFISKYYFFDLELIHLVRINKLSLKCIGVNKITYKDSSIKLFDIKNFKYLYELMKILLILSFKKN